MNQNSILSGDREGIAYGLVHFVYSFGHILSKIFLLHYTTHLNTLLEEKKEPGGPYRFGKALRALSIFSLFYLVEWAHFPRKS